MARLSGSTAIVTGASEGIAEGIARTLALEGASVALVSRTLSRVQVIAADIEAAGASALAVQADVTRAQDVREMVKTVLDRWGAIDILVNGVGGFRGHGSILETSESEWDEVITLNMKTAFLCAQAVAGSMMEKHHGRIINIGSQAATAPSPGSNSFLPYAAAKAGLIGFTKHLAKQLGPYGVTVNAVSPSTTLTPRARRNRDAASIARMKSENPMKTLIEVEDTAQAVLFLASNEARYITGVNLNVNAGTLIV
ncbi:MAG TPA: SDR family NAD(P)-dependent oxidoreductase [Burkholderiales bacterium]